MSRMFKAQFSVDENLNFIVLESLRCKGFEIANYTEEYYAKVEILTHPLDHRTMRLVKPEFINSLPFYIKEVTLRNQNSPNFDFADMHLEARWQIYFFYSH